ncbi:S-adenosyl-L-methionine-dependent methyltransferase [Diaporthe sp. PMI_573]|nr:S-adenosyl-L-methionine-dependent methyltransferase [Diaporthaceae sp. PMI_573]
MPPNTYPLPPPAVGAESARLNIQHELSLLDQDGALLVSQFPSSYQQQTGRDGNLRVADAGTGTGIWAVQFAQQHPDIQVVGYDLGIPPPQPDGLLQPSNVHFATQDLMAAWPTGGVAAGPFDLVHCRQVLLNVPDPAKVLRRLFENLRPGGIVEIREYWNPMVSERDDDDDAAGEPEDPSKALSQAPLLVEWHRGTVEAAAALGCDHGYAARLPGALRDAGFSEVTVTDRKVPLGGWGPDGGRQQDERARRMDSLLCKMIEAGAPVMTKEMFVKGLGWTEERAASYAARVVDEFRRTDLALDKIYARFRVATARKPIM